MTRARRRRPGHPWAALKGTDPALHELAHYLRGLIDNAGKTLQQLASDLECSTSTMSKRLNGSMLPEQKFVRAVARVCAPDAASLDKRLTEAGMRWEKAHRNQGHVTATRAADDARAMVIATQQQVIQAHEQLHEANLQLLASERAEQRTTKMIWVLTSLLGHVMRRVQEVTAQRDAAERDLTEIHRRTQDQLDRATAEHERARCLVRAAENKVAVLHGKLRALTAPDDVRSVVDEQAEIDDLNAGLDRMHRLLDEQEEELNRLTEQIEPFETAGATFEDLAEASFDGIIVTDTAGRFIRTNEAFRKMIGHTADKLAELSFFELIHPSNRESLAVQYQNLIDGRKHRALLSTRLVLVDSTVVRVDLVATLLRRSGASSQILTVVEDNTELRLLQDELSRQSLYDVLTGLPNRQYFATRLETALRRQASGTVVTLYHIQLDAFSLISAGLGRAVSDKLLMLTAQRLKAMFAAEDAMVARFDGDEFAVFVANKPDSPDIITTIALINEELSESPVYFDGRGVATTACIGVVDRPPDDMDVAEVLRASAMTWPGRETKASGSGRCSIRTATWVMSRRRSSPRNCRAHSRWAKSS
ncbi:diguanylate cyclase domain-containing protein [Kibdelosporangium aridum]|uniref:diguanylate cyclase domain-containing protein n=1 Tax=Kibdelosporangium aridum TaxID=2030 RepID=UPI0035EA7B5E